MTHPEATRLADRLRQEEFPLAAVQIRPNEARAGDYVLCWNENLGTEASRRLREILAREVTETDTVVARWENADA